MSRRNFILLIIILAVIVAVILGFLYLNRPAPGAPNNGGGGTNFFSQFNPFGSKPTPPDTKPPTNQQPGTITPGQTAEVKLLKVSTMPIAGYEVFQKERYKEIPVTDPGTSIIPSTSTPSTPTTTKTTKPVKPPTEFVPNLRYTARADGNIYQTFADKVEELKFSTTIIPQVYEALFGNKGESVVMRYLKDDETSIASFAGSLPKEILGVDATNNNEVKGTFLPDNISDMSISPDFSKMFYLLPVGEGVVGVTAGLAGDKKIQVFDSPFTEWLSSWPNVKMITLTTKPSSGVPGYMFAINPDKKDFTKILGNIGGLTTLTSPNGKLVLYGDSNSSLNIYTTDTRSTTPLSIKGMPEKCVWSKTNTNLFCAVPKFIPSGLYPDSWYQGENSFSDSIWKVDVVSGTATMLLDPVTVVGGEDIDGTKLMLDDGENFLFFVNKKDSFLWEFKLN